MKERKVDIKILAQVFETVAAKKVDKVQQNVLMTGTRDATLEEESEEHTSHKAAIAGSVRSDMAMIEETEIITGSTNKLRKDLERIGSLVLTAILCQIQEKVEKA
jgi:hypothetical protein